VKRILAAAGLTVGLLSPLALAAPTYAAAETCNGLPATLVGTPGATLTGTEAADVVVSNGAVEVKGLGGDDVICTTGSTATLGPSGFSVRVFGGAGNDVVDRRGDLDPAASGIVYPEAGRDQVLGSAYVDAVYSGDGERDAISTFGGDDEVNTLLFQPAGPLEPEVIDLGPGDDSVRVGTAFTPDMTVAGAEGQDRIDFLLPESDGWVVDAQRGRLRQGSSVRTAFGGFETYEAGSIQGRSHWRFVGGDAPEHVRGYFPEIVGADLAGGDDVLDLAQEYVSGHPRVDFRGGLGRDLLTASVKKTQDVRLDLGTGRLRVADSAHGRTAQFEDATVAGAEVTLVGTGRDNVLSAQSCRVATLRGLGGADTLSLARSHYRSCPRHLTRTAFGASGPDVLTGSETGDRLDGGRGRDRADGRQGRDTCVSVEEATSCERAR
jgi:hypothetical protein